MHTPIHPIVNCSSLLVLADSKEEAKEAKVEGSKTLEEKAKDKTERVGDIVRGALN